jgi:predicted DNA-binding protein YlxM (UPF0122 family)
MIDLSRTHLKTVQELNPPLARFVCAQVWTGLYLAGVSVYRISKLYNITTQNVDYYLQEELDRLGLSEEEHKSIHEDNKRSVLKYVASPKQIQDNDSKLMCPRNMDMYKKFKDGETLQSLAIDHEISKQRVQQIINRISQRLGEDLTERERKLKMPVVSDNLKELYQEGKVTLNQIADWIGCKEVRRVAKVLGVNWNENIQQRREERKQKTLEKYKAINDLFMSGKTMKEIAVEFNTSVGCIGQTLNRYRKMGYAEPKRKYNSPLGVNYV